jgi:ankyrin repeat protein
VKILVRVWMIALAGLTGAVACAPAEPRAALSKLRVDYSAEAFVTQAGEGDARAVELFLAAGMPADTRGAGGATALLAASHGGHIKVVRALLAAGANPNLRDEQEMSPLAAAAAKGRTDVAQALLEKGADVLADRPVSQSPLMRAIRGGHHEMVRLLLDKGARAYVQDDQWSPLMLASFLGNEPSVALLLTRKPDVNAKNGRGMTSLMLAASRGHAPVIRTLIAGGANVDAVDAGGHTALMFAANNGQQDAAQALLDARANVTRANRNGATALTLAEANGYQDIASLLKNGRVTTPSATRPAPKAPARPDGDIRKLAAESLTFPDERRLYADAAATAWRFVEAHYQPATGLIDATDGYPFATIWDIGSGLSALYVARELSLLDGREYDRRMRRALGTLATVQLFDTAAFNKVYATADAAMVSQDHKPSARGIGWSAVDIGRLLVWLRIIADHHAEYRDDIGRIVARLDMRRLIAGGYLQGEDLTAAGEPRQYQEGRVGYEQYAARGFAAWNATASRALRLDENSVPVTVMGQTLPADLRSRDRLTSDPLLLLGLEFGWDSRFEAAAERLLAAQETRYRQTGRVTLVGEDAIARPPHFFYYYCAFANGKDFAVDVQDPTAVVNEPRWVSAKGAFAWHVLRPTAYTELALRTVAPAATPRGWGSGVYEQSGASTGTLNINTAAVILTAALVHKRGESMLR